jgi:hypothetical protein
MTSALANYRLLGSSGLRVSCLPRTVAGELLGQGRNQHRAYGRHKMPKAVGFVVGCSDA